VTHVALKHPLGVVLVTGASSGIGLATANLLYSRGWTVIGVSRRGVGGDGWQHKTMDVCSDEDVTRTIREVVSEHGRLDALVCCAGVGLAGPVETTSIAAAHAQLETNFWGVARSVQAALSDLRESRGRIVVISSVAGVLGLPFQAYYSASKFALEGWAESLSWEVEPFGVRVTLVQPGNYKTGFTDARETHADDERYRSAADAAISRMESDEKQGRTAESAAGEIVSVLERKNPPMRCTIGALQERSGAWARRLLPFRLFKLIAASSLKG
jgi:NAD(P)-dependent dehydrogenase (short-subunit alcohol dehydrogenase family)